MSPDVPRQAHFTLSAPSTRSPSPAPSEISSASTTSHIYITETDGFMKPREELKPPGRRPMDVYDANLPPWRAAIRRKLVYIVKKESRVIARMQNVIRAPWLDAYFVYTSSLGTHTCFMIVLPALFFFGSDELGYGILMVLALGVYCSSFIKDLFCSPRPFAPPVTRLTIGTHHLEYGFPSTHSTNSVSIALYLLGNVYLMSIGDNPSLSERTANILTILLGWYMFSIVYGRIYTAMHSFTDCAMGVFLGAGLWWAFSDFPGWKLQLPTAVAQFVTPLLSTNPGDESVLLLFRSLSLTSRLQNWVRTPVLYVPPILIGVCLLLVKEHPVPVDDCPCFEDAIAFGAVVLGDLLGQWADSYWQIGNRLPAAVMPGSGWALDASLQVWTKYERGWSDVALWWLFATIKMVSGILIIFIWRIVAKSTMHLVLPPTYRLLSRAFELPNRRFYTPATDYKSLPSEFANANGLKTIPSVIDLPSTAGVGVEVGGIGSGMNGHHKLGQDVKLRSRNGNGNGHGSSHLRNEYSADDYDSDSDDDEDEKEVKHYDADVLTKVVVYAGIGLLATKAIPILFELVGLGVNSVPPAVVGI